MKNQSVTISKRTLIISIIAVIVVTVGVIVGVLMLNGKKTEPVDAPVNGTPATGTQSVEPDIDPNAAVWDGLQPEDKIDGTQTGIKIPGYPSITIPKDTSEVSVALLNPEGNPCYFKFELVLKDSGETLYTSKLVPPGQAITKIALSKPLIEGEYPAIIRISTVSLADGSAMNGANVETLLISK